jgi:DNA-binding transcriptional LysR family regulator
MDFKRLEAFCRVYERRSFSRAGEDLYLSQPTVSAHILALEKDLGCRLFDRLGRSVLPTAAGEVLYQHATEAFAALQRAQAELDLLQNRVAGELVVGCSTIPAHYLLPELLAGFKRLYPEVRPQLSVADSAEVVERVASGELLVGVAGAREHAPDLLFEPLLTDELVLIAAPGLAGGRTHLDRDSLTGLPWVLRERGSGTRRALERGLAELGLSVRALEVSMVAESTQAVLQCVKAGLGVSITSRLAARDLLAAGDLVALQAPELSLQRRFYCVRHARRHLLPAALTFVEYVINECRRRHPAKEEA